MRLPTEIEWEYSCRAGSATRYFFGDDSEAAAEQLWCRESSASRVRRLDQKPANDFGLYGMLGGVWDGPARSIGPIR